RYLSEKDPLMENVTSVGKYSPAGDSPYGCADMAGNIWEWCADDFESGKSLRGGAFNLSASFMRCICRRKSSPAIRSDNRGFRVCVSLV
ncbi:MAG: SUMF1/EgtB/PvdO family nonheme iron enzyme, partial [Saprospiraceae bacterium]|nr:SUMF1/EgtB/PvdO family nonheme iron enzyme [Saprospiraceae bacterium]